MKLVLKKRQEGFSMIFVMSLGTIAVLSALALTESLLPIYRNIASQSYMNQASAAAESAAQYGIAYLNNSAAMGTLSNSASTLTIPNTISGTSSATVYISAATDPASTPDLSASAIYNSQNQFTPSGAAVAVKDYRVLTAVALNGPFTRGLRVILGPNPFLQNSQTTPVPFFNMALFANQQLNIASGVTITTDDGTLLTANIGSNSFTSLGGNNTINGSIAAFNSSPNPNTPSISAPSAVSTTGIVTVLGDVNYSGTATTSSGVGPAFVDNTNVFHDGIQPTMDNGVGVQNAANPESPAAPQINTAQPATFTVDQTGTSTQKISFTPNPTGPTDLGSLNLTAGQTLVLPPGQYTASSLTMDPASNIQLSSPGTNGVQLYIQGQGSTVVGSSGEPTVVSLNGNISGNNLANNLQIFYNGSQAVQMTTGGKPMYAMLYAPNADVTIDTSNGGQYHGAVTGNNLNIANSTPGTTGFVYFNSNSINPNAGSGAPGPGYNLAKNAQSTTDLTQSFNVLSWRELVPIEIPNTMSP